MINTDIVNVVATAALRQELDLDDLGKSEEILHDPDIYDGRVAYFKKPNMEGRVSIFCSGKMISVGTKSELGAFQELELTKNFLVERGFVKQTPLCPKIHNIVVKTDLGGGIDLEQLSMKCRMIYEPEQFPGGILKFEEPHKATVLLFSSGKAVILGVKNSKQIAPLVKRLVSFVKIHKSFY